MSDAEDGESGWDLRRFSKLRARIQARVRRWVPARMVEELADRALVRAFVVSLERGDIRDLEGLALRIADHVCADWLRRRERRGKTQPMPPDDSIDEDAAGHGSDAQRLLAWLEVHLPELRLSPRQEELVGHLQAGCCVAEIRERMSLSHSELSDLVLHIAKKVLRIFPKTTPP